jgi:hypothetical protein
MLGQADHAHAFAWSDLTVGIGEDEELAAAGADFSQIALEFFEQLIVRGDGHHRHGRGDQGQWPVLEFPGRIGLGMDVADLLQLERAFEGDRVMQATAEEEGVFLIRKELRPGDDLRLQREHGAQRRGQMAQAFMWAASSAAESRPRSLASVRLSRKRAASCVVKALVEATPISTPARVM